MSSFEPLPAGVTPAMWTELDALKKDTTPAGRERYLNMADTLVTQANAHPAAQMDEKTEKIYVDALKVVNAELNKQMVDYENKLEQTLRYLRKANAAYRNLTRPWWLRWCICC